MFVRKDPPAGKLRRRKASKVKPKWIAMIMAITDPSTLAAALSAQAHSTVFTSRSPTRGCVGAPRGCECLLRRVLDEPVHAFVGVAQRVVQPNFHSGLSNSSSWWNLAPALGGTVTLS